MQPFTFAFVFSLFPFNAWNSSQSETHVGHFHSLAEVAAAGGRQSRVKLLWQICFCSRGVGGGRGQWELAGKTGRPISGEHCEFPKAKGHSRPILRNHSQSRCLEDFRIFMEIQRKILFFFPPFQVSRQRWKSNRMRYCLDAKYRQSDRAFDTWKQHRWISRFFEKPVSLLSTGLEVL